MSSSHLGCDFVTSLLSDRQQAKGEAMELFYVHLSHKLCRGSKEAMEYSPVFLGINCPIMPIMLLPEKF